MFIHLLVQTTLRSIQVNDTDVSTLDVQIKRSTTVWFISLFFSSLSAGVTAHSDSLCSSLCTSVSLASTFSSVLASLVGAPGEKMDLEETKILHHSNFSATPPNNMVMFYLFDRQFIPSCF